ncbi:hypothetical protein GCM10009687_42790 [Asanoa iriomotensis]|uniref:Uncharacterized protein n=1 Tax=Asanoa iriomotensis TaxID=234613 RepID=A0ABQ4C1B9_9ACTN|nr:hypothetical protein Air01nite_26640 [Asanoa iriomotensis]
MAPSTVQTRVHRGMAGRFRRRAASGGGAPTAAAPTAARPRVRFAFPGLVAPIAFPPLADVR